MKKVYVNNSLEETFFNEFGFAIYDVAPTGIIQEEFSDIAWEIAKQEKISSRIDFNTTKPLFAAYEQQQTVLSTLEDLLTFLDQPERQRKKHIKETFLIIRKYLNEVIGQEENLIINYEEALKTLENY